MPNKNPATDKPKTSRTLQPLTFGAWTVSVSRKDKTVKIETNDYHADPLVLTRDELITIVRQMGLKVRKRNRKKQQNATAKAV